MKHGEGPLKKYYTWYLSARKSEKFYIANGETRIWYFLKIVKQGEGPNKNDKCYLSAIKANEEAEVIAIKLFIKNAIQQGCASTNIL